MIRAIIITAVVALCGVGGFLLYDAQSAKPPAGYPSSQDMRDLKIQ